MPKKQKTFTKRVWFWIALVSLTLAAPNMMIIRMFVGDAVDPFLWVFVRSGIVAAVCLPFIFLYRKSIKSRKMRRQVLFGSAMMTTAIIAHTKAIELSSASYVAVIALAFPIFLVTISAWMFGERITRRAMAGIGLGALGGAVLVLMPLLISNGSVEFNLLATLLGLVNLIGFTLATANMRKLNEKKVPLVLQIGISALMMVAVSGVLFVMTGAPLPKQADAGFWLAAAYSGVGVMLLVRLFSTAAYSYIGGATMGALNYVEVLLAIVLPVFILGERLSIAMVVGGLMIVLGVYLLEHHKNPKHAHHKHHS